MPWKRVAGGDISRKKSLTGMRNVLYDNVLSYGTRLFLENFEIDFLK